MATIHLVVPPIQRDKFGGGLLCALEYAKGLRSRGHCVNVIPLLPSPSPRWFAGDIGSIPRLKRMRWLWKSMRRLSSALASRGAQSWYGDVWDITTIGLLCAPRVFSPTIQQALGMAHVRIILESHLPLADATLATSYQTALPVHLYGTGRKFYFAQHYEPYFSIDAPEPKLAELAATSTYRLPLKIIANSSWLRAKLQSEIMDADVSLCPNAIDHQVFNGEPKTEPLGIEIRVISYGGRGAQWKGFREMAEAMKIARSACSDKRLRWLVYGSAALPPDNSIASYEALGFLNSVQLADAYRAADIFLSASWYESFPLFPLEAMSCGLPVVTTQPGTEEFATHESTAQIVEPRNPERIAAGLIRLIREQEYRTFVAANGNRIAREFSWQRSVTAMENILLR